MSGFCGILLLIILTFTGTESARILAYFPTPSISHQVVFRPIVKELARRGHEVTVITTDPVFSKSEAPENLTEIDVHDISYKNWEQFLNIRRGQKEDLWDELKLVFESMTLIFEMQMQVPVVKEIMNRDKNYFDLLLIEACHRPAMGLMHKFDAPAIQISSLGGLIFQYESMGAPIHPLFYPTVESRRLYNLTILEKGLAIYGNLLFRYLLSVVEEFDTTILKKIFGNDIPPYKDLQQRIAVLLLNEHPIWADNRPVPPNIIYMGGIHQTIPKHLPEEIKEYIKSSKNGIIYVSFGTNVIPSLLPPEKIRVMTNVFSQLPYNVLWKWDKDVLPGKSNNIKISKWFPQADILKHPKVKLFITQGGLQSTDEAIDAAIPLLGIPMLADQWYNVEKYTKHKIGMQLDMGEITEIEFRKAITTLIEDMRRQQRTDFTEFLSQWISTYFKSIGLIATEVSCYKNNMLKLRSRVREYPIKPISLAVEWAEYIIKHGGDHLKSSAAGLSWIEYYEIKLVLTLFGILLIFIGICVYILKFTFGIFINISKKKMKLKKN